MRNHLIIFNVLTFLFLESLAQTESFTREEWKMRDSLRVINLNTLISEKKIPGYKMKIFQGKLLEKKDLKGKVVVLHFWRHDCAPCVNAFPLLNEVSREFKDNNDVLLLGITSDTILKKTFNYNMVPWGKRIMDIYGIKSVPTSIIFNKEGKAIKWITGYTGINEKDELIGTIRNALNENKTNYEKSALRNVYYDFGKSELRSESFVELDKLVSKLKTTMKGKIIITGHTDNFGEQKNNQKLSEERAEAIKNYLMSKGIDIHRIETKGMGSKKPIADNKTNKGREKNRRVEIILR